MESLETYMEDFELARHVVNIKGRLVMNYIEETRSLMRALIKKNEELAQKNESLTRLFFSTIKSLVVALEARDEYTEGHSHRVAFTVKAIGSHLGWDQNSQESLEIAGLLHDLGKIGIPDAILGKPDRLTDMEFAKMKEHPLLAAKIINEIEGMEKVSEWILHHHERIDGYGYPDGLVGDTIPMGARILAVADAFDAMVSDRPYRKALSFKKAMQELQEGQGRQFDEKVVNAFLSAKLGTEMGQLSHHFLPGSWLVD